MCICVYIYVILGIHVIYVIGWSNSYFNNLHFINSLEINDMLHVSST